jgi:hypothetical protein
MCNSLKKLTYLMEVAEREGKAPHQHSTFFPCQQICQDNNNMRIAFPPIPILIPVICFVAEVMNLLF